jgi:hypothetical protein
VKRRFADMTRSLKCPLSLGLSTDVTSQTPVEHVHIDNIHSKSIEAQVIAKL